MRFTILAILSLGFLSCGSSNDVAERKVVPPPGSDGPSMPWNIPIEGQGGGPLGGALERR